ncbi:MAG: hypothetical protein PHG81_03190 [Aliarcobacter sp.]|nr:hypothetical protein [Aliarcobacter sp.]
MPYLVSSIIAVVAATIILLTRYEADDSAITAELDRMKSMFLMVDGFVNTFVQSGGDLTSVNFQKLSCSGILSGNIKDTLSATDCDTTVTADGVADNVTGSLNTSKLTFPSSTVIWQLIPNKDDNSSYKLLVDMTKNSALKSRGTFSESFSGREFCEKMLFGTFQTTGKSYDSSTVGKEDFKQDGTNNDGLFVCIVFK